MDKSQAPETTKKSIFIVGPTEGAKEEFLEEAVAAVAEQMSDEQQFVARHREAERQSAAGNGGFQEAIMDHEEPEGSNLAEPGEKSVAKSIDDLASELVLGKGGSAIDEGIDYNEILEKGKEGEGSRGGTVVGHYPSGKPIYKRDMKAGGPSIPHKPLGDKLKHAEEHPHGAYHVEDHGAGVHALMFKKPKARYAEYVSTHNSVESAKQGIARHSKHASDPKMSEAASKVAQAATTGNPVNIMGLGKIHDAALAALKEGKSHEDAVAAVRQFITEAKKSLDEDGEILEKAGGHKYIKRTGTPGNYRYEYAKPGDSGAMSVKDAAKKRLEERHAEMESSPTPSMHSKEDYVSANQKAAERNIHERAKNPDAPGWGKDAGEKAIAEEFSVPSVSAVLQKLRVRSGLMPGFAKVGPHEVRFGYSREKDSFVLTMRGKEVRIPREFVETRSKSPWMSDQTHRLTAAGVEFYAHNISSALSRLDAKEKGLPIPENIPPPGYQSDGAGGFTKKPEAAKTKTTVIGNATIVDHGHVLTRTQEGRTTLLDKEGTEIGDIGQFGSVKEALAYAEKTKKSLEGEFTMSGINGLNEYLEKSTPIGGTTPGGYKKVAEGKYVKEGQKTGGEGGAAPAKKKREAAPHNEHNVRELGLYEENDGDLHRQSKEPIRANLMRKIAAGKYDHEKAKKLWQYHADRAAQKYTKEFDEKGAHGSHGAFSPSDRKKLAADLADQFKQEADDGEHDHHIPKKYQKKGGDMKKGFSGIDGLAAFAAQDHLDAIYEGVQKSDQDMPTGEAKLDQGHGEDSPNGGSLEGTPKPKEEGAAGGSHDPGAPSVPEKKLSEDDDDVDDQLKGGPMKPMATAKSMTGYTRHELEHTVAKDKAAFEANLRKGQADVQVGVGIAPPKAAPEVLEKASFHTQGSDARVLYSNQSDLEVERLMKSEFYWGGEPSLGFRPGLVAQTKACGACNGVMAKSLSACPHCGTGAVAPAFELSKSEGEPTTPRGAPRLRPARGEADLHLPNGYKPGKE